MGTRKRLANLLLSAFVFGGLIAPAFHQVQHSLALLEATRLAHDHAHGEAGDEILTREASPVPPAIDCALCASKLCNVDFDAGDPVSEPHREAPPSSVEQPISETPRLTAQPRAPPMIAV